MILTQASPILSADTRPSTSFGTSASGLVDALPKHQIGTSQPLHLHDTNHFERPAKVPGTPSPALRVGLEEIVNSLLEPSSPSDECSVVNFLLSSTPQD